METTREERLEYYYKKRKEITSPVAWRKYISYLQSPIYIVSCGVALYILGNIYILFDIESFFGMILIGFTVIVGVSLLLALIAKTLEKPAAKIMENIEFNEQLRVDKINEKIILENKILWDMLDLGEKK